MIDTSGCVFGGINILLEVEFVDKEGNEFCFRHAVEYSGNREISCRIKAYTIVVPADLQNVQHKCLICDKV